jgi:hypothetical protein
VLPAATCQRAQRLGQVDGRERRAVGDRVRDGFGPRLVAEIGQQRGGVQYRLAGTHLLFAFCLRAPLREQLLDKRAGELGERAAALVSYSAERAESQRPIVLLADH